MVLFFPIGVHGRRNSAGNGVADGDFWERRGEENVLWGREEKKEKE